MEQQHRRSTATKIGDSVEDQLADDSQANSDLSKKKQESGEYSSDEYINNSVQRLKQKWETPGNDDIHPMTLKEMNVELNVLLAKINNKHVKQMKTTQGLKGFFDNTNTQERFQGPT